MTASARLCDDVIFRPEAFFLGHTVGAGVVRDLLGRVTRRFSVDTRGVREEAYGAIKLDETYAFDNGEIEVMRWMISAAGPNRYVLAEAKAGSGIVAQTQSGEMVFAYNRSSGGARGLASPHFAVRMTRLGDETILKAVKVSVLGAPLATLTGFHRRAA
jgi:hypothetical protein